MNTKRLSMTKKVLCMAAFALLLSAPAFAVGIDGIDVDGYVKGFAEGYTSGFDVSFNIENYPTVVDGGLLFTHETTELMYFGLILPLNIVDNTYAANKASDWGTTVHNLGAGNDDGGSTLEGSDKWELKLKSKEGDEFDAELKLDYIEEVDGVYSARVEKFQKEGSNLDQELVDFATSLHYNYHDLELKQYFENATDDSPSYTDGDYDFDSPAEAWIPKIMYEFNIDKDAFGISMEDWLAVIDKSVIHASPNKFSEKHKVFPILGDPINPVPEPATMLLLGSGLVGLAVFRRKFRGG